VPIEIRPARDDELRAYIDALSTAFLDRPDLEKITDEVRPLWDLQRTWGAFEDGRPCATFRSWATELTVPGGATLPGAAVAAVTVLPTHRRRGILRRMVAAEHAAARERGEAVAVLHASEYRIYGRFGYGPACRSAVWTLDTMAASFRGDRLGGVELVTPDEAARDAVKGVFEAWRHRQPGEIRRRDFRWDLDLGLREDAWDGRWKGFLALRRDAAGAVDGYARYRFKENWEQRQPRNLLNVDELHALSDEAYLALWRFLAEIDLVSSVKAERRHVSEALPWLLDNARAAVASEVGDELWVRLLDVSRALEGRAYERQDCVVLEIVDPDAPAGRQRLELDAGPDGATCRPTKASPELTIDVSALAAAYLGGASLRDAVMASGADEHQAGALARADALLRTLDEPWCSTFF
jgi:predicted acetyltransferase